MRAARTALLAAALAAALAVVPGGALAKTAQPFTARGSIGQAYVLGAAKGDALTLLDRRGRTLATKRADRLGSAVFLSVTPGPGYRVRRRHGRASTSSAAFAVLRRGDNPKAAFYRREPKLKAGLNYITMRDGIELAVTVRLPAG